MTEQAVGAFVARMHEDESFRAEVLATEVGEDRLAFVNGAGYDITAQDLVDTTSALSDEDLAGVHGGTVPYAPTPDAPSNPVADGASPGICC